MAWHKWRGGRYWTSKTGKKTYYIVKKVNGKSYQINTKCSDEKSAYVHLLKFESEPNGYSSASVKRDSLQFTDELVERFLEYGVTEKQNGEEWRHQFRLLLAWWKDNIPSDLRTIPKQKFEEALKGTKNRVGKTKCIRSFYGWLVKTEQIAVAENGTYFLKVPITRPEQWSRQKHVPFNTVMQVLEHMKTPYKELIMILVGTGMHVKELERFHKSGVVQNVQGQHVLVIPYHKIGGTHRVAVSEKIAGIASIILQMDFEWTHKTLFWHTRKACKKAVVNYFSPGQLRHTFATYALEQGSSPESIAAALNHRSFATTKRFYMTLGIPPKVKTML